MYNELEYKSWNDLKDFLSSLNSNWIFRGQSDYSWKLESSIDRVNLSAEIDYKKKMFEDFYIRDFKRNPHLYSSKYSVHSDFQILSTLQHYGTPTRLLDFSQSQYVATYFAIINSDTDCSIYAINYLELTSSTKHLFRLKYDNNSPEIKAYREGGSISDDGLFQALVLGKQQRQFIDIVQPFFKFDRMIQQSGCFLCQGDINSNFESNLKANHEILKNMPECSPYYKIRIKKEWKEEIIRDLERMNITSASIFPGMEGYLKSLKNRFEILVNDTKDRIINNYG